MIEFFWVKKFEIFFLLFFRELSHSDAKNRKKFFFDFCPLGVTPAGVIEFFGSKIKASLGMYVRSCFLEFLRCLALCVEDCVEHQRVIV